MHAVVRQAPLLGLVFLLLAPPGLAGAVTAEVGELGQQEAGQQEAGQRQVGRAAPDLSLPALRSNAEPIDLADHRGKVVFVDFWSSWCAPCRRAMPRLDALRREFRRDGFEVIGVNVDLEPDAARRFLERTRVDYPLAADPGGEAANRFGVAVLPALVVVDRRGIVQHALTGRALEAPGLLRSTLQDLLAEEEVR